MVADRWMGDESVAAPSGGGEHTVLELRRVALGLCADLFRWIQTRDADESSLALRRHLQECRAQAAHSTGPVAGVDDAELADDPAGELERIEQVIHERDGIGLDTPLARLRRAASLDDLDIDLLLLAALPHQSALWGSLFAFLANASTVRRPTVHVALNFQHRGSPGAITTALASGPLVRHGLLRLEPADAPLADRAIILPAESWLALCGHDAVEPILAAWRDRGAPTVAPILPPALRAEVDAIAGRSSLRVVISGAPGTGRHTVARWIAARTGVSLVELRLPPGEPPAGWEAAAVRHALVRGAGLAITAAPSQGESITLGLDLPRDLPAVLILPERSDVRGATFADAIRLRLPQPSGRERCELWRRALGDDVAADPAELASHYAMNGGAITEVVRAARTLATLRVSATSAASTAPVPAEPAPTPEDLARAARLRPAVRLEALAARREARAHMDDLVLPPRALAQLDELAERVRHRDRVFEDWGFAARVGHRQTSVLALFTGPSGTGPTLAAEAVATRLALDLYCIDLSQVVSKYIGETEKNLSRGFAAAEGAAAVLFFDEADGIFGKRTETRDAHDRYANLEVSYLLARLETFTGLAIMASNLRQNIDHAFLRRMDHVVEFPTPDTGARVALWQRHLRCNAPIADDVDPRELAELFPVTGAHIRNAAVGGAFFAASDGGRLTRHHLLAAMRREYDKLGKSFPLVTGGPP